MDSLTSGHTHSWTTEILFYSSLTLGLTLALKYLLSSKVPANIPPLPAKPYPILGHLPYFKSGLGGKLEEWRKATGDIFSLYFGSKLVVILNSYDLVYEAYVAHGDTLSDRPADTSGGEETNLGMLISSGPLWREQRTAAMQILRSLGMGKNTLALRVSEEAGVYIEALSQLSGKPTQVHTLTNTAIANVICSIIVGKRFEYDDAYFVKFLHMMNELSALLMSSSMSSSFPWLRHLPGDLFKAKRRIETEKNIMAFFCDHYIEKSEEEFDGHDVNNFIDAYLLKMKHEQQQGNETTLNKKNLRRNLFDLFIAGTETTSASMMWFFVNLLYHPEKQEKMFREISEQVGTERAVTMQDRANLHYSQAAITESLRLSDLGTFGPPHSAKEDTVVAGYTIPAGTTIFVNFDALFWSDTTYEDPKEFKPERFLDAHGKFDPPEKFLTFGIGRRQCPGESLARMELFLFLTSIIQRFQLQPAVPGQLPSKVPVPGLVTPPQPFQIRFVDRLRQ